MEQNPSPTVKMIEESNRRERERVMSVAEPWEPSPRRDVRDLRSPAVLGEKLIEVTSAMRLTNRDAKASDVATFLHV